MSTHTPLAALDGTGLRRTEQRRLVGELITARTGYFTAADLAADAEARGVALGRATIFRTLEVLLQMGVVERIDLPGGAHAYVGCAPRHHHHAVCSGCGAVVDFDDRELTSVVADVALRTGFRIDMHRLELFGLCPACQAAGADGA
jgi:Fur family ferric uptake transcriptional regulator